MLYFYHSTYPTNIPVDTTNEAHLELVLMLKECDNSPWNLDATSRRNLARLFVQVFGPDLRPRTDVSLWERDEKTRLGHPLKGEELADVFPKTF